MAKPHGLRSSALSPFVPLGWRCFSWHASLEGLVWFIIKGTDEFPNTGGQRWGRSAEPGYGQRLLSELPPL